MGHTSTADQYQAEKWHSTKLRGLCNTKDTNRRKETLIGWIVKPSTQQRINIPNNLQSLANNKFLKQLSNREIGKGLRQFSKEEIQLAQQIYGKKMLKDIGEMQIRTTMKYHLLL